MSNLSYKRKRITFEDVVEEPLRQHRKGVEEWNAPEAVGHLLPPLSTLFSVPLAPAPYVAPGEKPFAGLPSVSPYSVSTAPLPPPLNNEMVMFSSECDDASVSVYTTISSTSSSSSFISPSIQEEATEQRDGMHGLQPRGVGAWGPSMSTVTSGAPPMPTPAPTVVLSPSSSLVSPSPPSLLLLPSSPSSSHIMTSTIEEGLSNHSYALAGRKPKPNEKEEEEWVGEGLLGDSRDLSDSGNEMTEDLIMEAVGSHENPEKPPLMDTPPQEHVKALSRTTLFSDTTNISFTGKYTISTSHNTSSKVCLVSSPTERDMDDELTQDDVNECAEPSRPGDGTENVTENRHADPISPCRLAASIAPRSSFRTDTAPSPTSLSLTHHSQPSHSAVLFNGEQNPSEAGMDNESGGWATTQDDPSMSGNIESRECHRGVDGMERFSLTSSSSPVYRRLDFDSLPSSLPNMYPFDHSLATFNSHTIPTLNHNGPCQEAESNCVLCQHMRVTSLPLDFPRCKVHDLTVHVVCALWCPEVYYDPRSGQVFKIDSALQRAQNISCSVCGGLGASVGCVEPSCQRSYHFPCTLSTGGKVCPSEFTFRCAEHTKER